jgi:WD40 repeat protein
MSNRNVSAIPFRVLDAPRVRDDYYCSVLAYSYTARTLAVAIGSHVYIWTEQGGVQNPPLMPFRLHNYVTSVSFSSTNGGHAILAVARQNGQVTLWSVFEDRVRHEVSHENSVSCVSFKPAFTYRTSTHMRLPRVACEDLLVGDDLGDVYYYSIEWPDPALRRLEPNWNSTVTTLAKISAHSQQICGLAWSPDNKYFVTGGNDNAALLFDISKILKSGNERGRTRYRQAEHEEGPTISTPYERPSNADLVRGWNRFSEDEVRFGNSGITIPGRPRRPVVFSDPQFRNQESRIQESRFPRDPQTLTHPPGMHSRVFIHSAAVKALAFAPWQPSLLATGGGSNDRQIHFFHTGTGAVLALINVFAQVTSLIWSTTKREICATFGYAQPEHKIRIAVFAWPSCECVVSIPWESRILAGEVPRALWAIRYPGRPNGQGDTETRGRRNVNGNGSVRRRRSREGEVWASRTEEEGCIIVAGSDESIKFHEVWAGEKRGGMGGQGLGSVRGVFGGSRILEGVFEGIEVEEFEEGEVIR